MPRAFRHRKWTASSRRTAIFIWRSKTPPKSMHDLLRLTSQCSSIRGSQKPRLPKRSQILALIRTNVAQRTEGQEYPGERAQPGGRSTHWIPSDSTRRRGRCSKSLIPRGKMGRPEEICDGRAVSCFRRSELREWGGVVCRQRILGNLNRRVTKSRLRNTVPSLDGKRPFRKGGPRQGEVPFSSLPGLHRDPLRTRAQTRKSRL